MKLVVYACTRCKCLWSSRTPVEHTRCRNAPISRVTVVSWTTSARPEPRLFVPEKDDGHFLIERIARARLRRRGREEKPAFLVQWKGYHPVRDATWEPVESFIPDTLREFFETQ